MEREREREREREIDIADWGNKQVGLRKCSFHAQTQALQSRLPNNGAHYIDFLD